MYINNEFLSQLAKLTFRWESHMHRIRESCRSEGISGDDLVQPPRSKLRSQREQVAQDISSGVLNIADNGDFTTSLGNPYQRFITLTIKKIYFFFLYLT